ncbi:MAG: hypothetical protein IIC78_07595 [Chloroflexi bacterium]|nr:hypothetical protein [Chloroflexota bacterium]
MLVKIVYVVDMLAIDQVAIGMDAQTTLGAARSMRGQQALVSLPDAQDRHRDRQETSGKFKRMLGRPCPDHYYIPGVT